MKKYATNLRKAAVIGLLSLSMTGYLFSTAQAGDVPSVTVALPSGAAAKPATGAFALKEALSIPSQQHDVSTDGPAEHYLGNAPYICTPSGFGETSKCFLRSRIRTAMHSE